MNKLFIYASLCVLAWSTGCHSEEKEHAEKESKFQVTSPVRLDTTFVKQYVCQIRSIQNIELRALERGYLQDIYVDEGKFVKQGQLMFRVMPNVYEAELMKAEAEVKGAEIEVSNAKTLADNNVVSKNELLKAEANLEKAKAARQLAKVHLSFTEIRAPFSGIMNRLKVRKGSLVDEGDLLTTLSDNSKMWVYFNVPEAEYLNYKNHNDGSMQNVSLMMANHELFKYPGKVETIEGEFDNETGNIAFRATFPNPEGLLRHGETGNVQVTVPLKNAMLIPQKTTFEVLDKIYVYVIDKENRVRSRQVTIGAELPHLYAISAGLSEGDKILLEGLRKVKENEKIEYDFAEPSHVLSNLNLYAE
jgi:membrane fusion protein (multidrug efflux system)